APNSRHVAAKSARATGFVVTLPSIGVAQLAPLHTRDLQLDATLQCPVHEIVRMPPGERWLRPIDLESGAEQRTLQPVAQAHVVATEMRHRCQRLATAMHGQRDT